jgi:predicted RNA-binding Zn-ribbon protein involved in translation (DUF1610 family)
MVARRTGRPMLCPNCEGEVFIDAPHMCPEETLRPAAAGTVLHFFGYNSLNQCCRSWVLLGWPEVDGRPKLTDDERGRMHFDCPKCHKDLWFNMTEPDLVQDYDVRLYGKPQPPALVGGKITVTNHSV